MLLSVELCETHAKMLFDLLKNYSKLVNVCVTAGIFFFLSPQ